MMHQSEKAFEAEKQHIEPEAEVAPEALPEEYHQTAQSEPPQEARETAEEHTNTSASAVEGEVVEGESMTADSEEAADLAQKLEHAEALATDYKNQWLRAVADYKNYKRRADSEREEIKRNANAGLILKLLQILDDFERAIESVPPEVAESPWWAGTNMILQKFYTILESENVAPIEALGQDFDPNFHHAVTYEEAEGQNEKVIAELQKGYTMHDRVIRPAMVKVGKG